MISAFTMARNKARRTLFQLSHSRLDLSKATLRRRAQPSEPAPATIQAMTRSPEGSPMRGAQESPGRSTSTRRARSSAGGPSSASAGGCASERGGEERLRDLEDGRDEEVKEEEPRVKPSSPRHF
jgi:hypothetical protein